MSTALKETITLKENTIMQSGIYMKTDPEGEIKYLQVKDINSLNEIDYSQMAMVKKAEIGGKHWLQKDDLLFAAKEASNCCVLYDGSEKNIITSSSFIIIRLISTDILPAFLCCFLNSPSTLEMLKSASVGTGIQVIPQSVLGNLKFGIPSIEVQKLNVDIDQLRREEEQVQSEMNKLKRQLQEQLLMNSLK